METDAAKKPVYVDWDQLRAALAIALTPLVQRGLETEAATQDPVEIGRMGRRMIGGLLIMSVWLATRAAWGFLRESWRRRALVDSQQLANALEEARVLLPPPRSILSAIFVPTTATDLVPLPEEVSSAADLVAEALVSSWLQFLHFALDEKSSLALAANGLPAKGEVSEELWHTLERTLYPYPVAMVESAEVYSCLTECLAKVTKQAPTLQLPCNLLLEVSKKDSLGYVVSRQSQE